MFDGRGNGAHVGMPLDATDLLQMGNRAVAARNFKAAEDAFRELVRLDPNSPEGYLGLAKVHLRQSHNSEVVSLLEPVCRRMPSLRVVRQLADAHRALALGPNAAPENADRAVALYEQLDKERPDPVCSFYLGEILREVRQDHRRALTAYQRSWELSPGSESVLEAASECAEALSDPEARAAVEAMRAHARH